MHTHTKLDWGRKYDEGISREEIHQAGIRICSTCFAVYAVQIHHDGTERELSAAEPLRKH